jgi:hypothetical protein
MYTVSSECQDGRNIQTVDAETILFRETAMLYKQGVSTNSNKQSVATVVSHELAHQWFGNLVTPSWWTDLWLNEGFASYVEYLGVNAVSISLKTEQEQKYIVSLLLRTTGCNCQFSRNILASSSNVVVANSEVRKNKTPWPESASKLYPPRDRRLSEKLVPTFADRGCHVVIVTNPYGRLLGFLDQSRYFSSK